MFDIPVVVFLFRRKHTLESIFSQIRKVKPKKIYLIADGPRNEEEIIECKQCREEAESLIDWDCEVIKNYAETNRGVYENIGLGSKWVLSKEEKAIFLEDDNYPDISFFEYCAQLLDKYEEDENVLWICGTNYLNNLDLKHSYVFTQHLLPCGWASWGSKYNKFYDGELDLLNKKEKLETFKASYNNSSLYKQQFRNIKRTKYLLETNLKKSSWDYQMLFSLRANDLYGIAPKTNLVTNIGADGFSTHGGNTRKKEMTNRFTMVETIPLEFPLKHPERLEKNEIFELEIGKIIEFPFKDKLMIQIGTTIKKIVGINENESLKELIKKKVNKGL